MRLTTDRFHNGLLVLGLSLVASGFAQPTYETPYAFTTVAGASTWGSSDGAGTAARFLDPFAIASDAAGTLYLADGDANTIRRITPEGVTSTLAGKEGVEGFFDATGAAAQFSFPAGIAVDAANNVYVADSHNNALRKISRAGAVTTVVKTLTFDGLSASTGHSWPFDNPSSLAVDAAGNIYVLNFGDFVVVVTPAGATSTLKGTEPGPGGEISRFAGLARDQAGNVYVSNYWRNTVQMISPAGTFSTLAGSDSALLSGSSDGLGSAARFYGPGGLAIDLGGYIYVADCNNHTVRKISPAGLVTTVAGLAGTNGYADDVGSAARFSFPRAVSVDVAGNIYVVDGGNNVIRKITPTGAVTTLAGLPRPQAYAHADGSGSAARLAAPRGLAVNSSGDVFVADHDAHTIRRIAPSGAVSTIAGSPFVAGSADGSGSAALFKRPSGLAFDAGGNLYVADQLNHTIRKITPAGVVSTWAGSAGASGSADGPGASARFACPTGVVADSTGNLYVTDQINRTIRKITPGGTVTTLAGLANQGGHTDGTGSSARFTGPSGIAVDASGTLYVTEFRNGLAIRKIATDGTVTTLAEIFGSSYAESFDGNMLGAANGIAVDGRGNIFIANTANCRIQEVTPSGVSSTVAGWQYRPSSTDGLGAGARFVAPQGIAVSPTGELWVSDSTTVRRGVLATVPATITAQPQSQSLALGASVTFSVTANGIPTPTYQWYCNGSVINGATGNSLSLSSVQVSDAGDYTVVVTNALGSSTSNKAALTVTSTTGASPPAGGPSSSGGGGGAVSPWFALALLAVAAIRARHAKPAKTGTIPC